MTKNIKDSILELHDFFFQSEELPSNYDIEILFESNEKLIQDGFSSPDYFDYSLRIQCEYCFALSELRKYIEAEELILKTLKLFNHNYKDEVALFNNVFYEKLIYSLMSAQFYNKKHDLARENLNLLLKYFPSNEIYHKWENVMPTENPFKRIISIFFR